MSLLLLYPGAVTSGSTAQITGATGFTFAPSGSATGRAALTGSANLVFAQTGTATGQSSLAGATSLTFAPTASITGRAALIGATSITFTPTGTATAAPSGSTVHITGSTSLSLTPAASLTAQGALTGTAALSFVLTGALSGAYNWNISPDVSSDLLISTNDNAAAPVTVVISSQPANYATAAAPKLAAWAATKNTNPAQLAHVAETKSPVWATG